MILTQDVGVYPAPTLMASRRHYLTRPSHLLFEPSRWPYPRSVACLLPRNPALRVGSEGGSNTASTEPLLSLDPALAALRVRMVEVNTGLQDALEVALTFGQNGSLSAPYDTGAGRKLTAAFRLVVENLGLSQHAAANTATRLAAAERAMDEFNQAISLRAREVEMAASPGLYTSGKPTLDHDNTLHVASRKFPFRGAVYEAHS